MEYLHPELKTSASPAVLGERSPEKTAWDENWLLLLNIIAGRSSTFTPSLYSTIRACVALEDVRETSSLSGFKPKRTEGSRVSLLQWLVQI